MGKGKRTKGKGKAPAKDAAAESSSVDQPSTNSTESSPPSVPAANDTGEDIVEPTNTEIESSQESTPSHCDSAGPKYPFDDTDVGLNSSIWTGEPALLCPGRACRTATDVFLIYNNQLSRLGLTYLMYICHDQLLPVTVAVKQLIQIIHQASEILTTFKTNHEQISQSRIVSHLNITPHLLDRIQNNIGSLQKGMAVLESHKTEILDLGELYTCLIRVAESLDADMSAHGDDLLHTCDGQRRVAVAMKCINDLWAQIVLQHQVVREIRSEIAAEAFNACAWGTVGEVEGAAQGQPDGQGKEG